MPVYKVDKLMGEARRLAAEYRQATGKPLPITAEIAVHDACTLLGLETADGNSSWDAVGTSGPWQGLKIQVKGRAIFDEQKSGHRMGQLKLDKEWDAVVLVIMDARFEPDEIYAASREEVTEALASPSSSKQMKKGAMSLARFKSIGRLVWSREDGSIDDAYWDSEGNH